MWTWPLAVMDVTSGFSLRRWHPILHTWKRHTGADLEAATGTHVYSIGAGTVVRAAYDPPRAEGGTGAGHHIRVSHGHGITSRYYHLADRWVEAGYLVQAGHVLGPSDSTGDSTGPHVHFEIRRWGIPVDPVAWLSSKITTSPAPTPQTGDQLMHLLRCKQSKDIWLRGPDGIVLLGDPAQAAGLRACGVPELQVDAADITNAIAGMNQYVYATRGAR